MKEKRAKTRLIQKETESPKTEMKDQDYEVIFAKGHHRNLAFRVKFQVLHFTEEAFSFSSIDKIQPLQRTEKKRIMKCLIKERSHNSDGHRSRG